MPEIEGLIPVIIGVALLCFALFFLQWFFTHPIVFIPVVMLIAFLIYRAHMRRRV